MTKKRVQCFIDRFNLYHGICDLKDNQLKWVDLRGLSSAFLQRDEELLNVYYFSAIADWLKDSKKRHITYLDALSSVDVTSKLGVFKKKPKFCRSCKAKWNSHEEKESDVNLAIQLVHNAHLDEFDKAILITADSDLIPPVQLIKKIFPEKEFLFLFPPGRKTYTSHIRKIAQFGKIKKNHISRNLLDHEIVLKTGKVIHIPAEYLVK